MDRVAARVLMSGDRAAVTFRSGWWRRLLFQIDDTKRIATRTRHGWHWEDNGMPIVEPRIEGVLAKALKRFRKRWY